MKVTQIIAEEKIDEAPVGAIKQGLRKMGAKALAKVGAKDTAAGIAGKVDAGDKANKLYTQFRAHLGSIGMSPKQVDATELRAWMAKNKLPVTSVPQSGILTPKQIQPLFVKAVQDSLRAASPSAATGTNAAGSPTTKQVDKNKDGKDDATGQPMKQASTQQVQIPANIQKQINSLSPEQKAQLASMI